MSARDEARLVQLRASRPTDSVVLRAAAGSGKTSALVARFLRLCLESGPSRARPATVLAVTFTRKAAVEIQERLRHQARELALAAPADRARRLAALFGERDGRPPDASEIAAAGALYEQLLADTAALNVGTIHAFCQLVLGRFSREAGLDPSFGVLEDLSELHDEAFERLVAEIARDDGLADCARRLGAHPDALRRTLQSCLDEAMRLERWLQATGGRPRGLDTPAGGAGDPAAAPPRPPRAAALPALAADLRRHLFPDQPAGAPDLLPRLGAGLASALTAFAAGLPTELDQAGVELTGKTPARVADLAAGAAALAASWPWASRPEAAAAPPDVPALAAAAAELLLTSENRLRVVTTGRDPAHKAAFAACLARAARPILVALQAVERHELLLDNLALLRLGLRLLDIVDELKRRDRVVDFQDLEDLASGLLADPERALELQYRLDDAIQHILVDEFQDTNVNQWDLLRPFVEEFRAGGDDRVRTVFLVGDVKQSIYGFRGAWPRLFGEVGDELARWGAQALTLPTNFRSLPAIVDGVGGLFAQSPLADRLEPAERDGVRQACARDDAPGEFALHAPFPDPEGPDGGAAGGGEQAAAVAAAALVRRLRAGGEKVLDPRTGERRPLQWRDVLVLARARTDFALYERAFREAGIPFVPPGRGMLAASREVQDVLALLRWLAWPDDSVALATVLRSPLARLDQTAFQSLLSRRGADERRQDGRWREPRTLWQALREAEDPRLGATRDRLLDWRRRLDFEPCHDLLRRVMREADLAQRCQLALGEQARFNLERLYDLALGPDVLGVPTARRLAEVIERAAGRGRLDEAPLPSDGEGRVRFLTVHGAKGLEAPVVLLVDADRAGGRTSARVCLDPAGHGSALLLRTAARHRRGIGLPDGVEPLPDPLATAVRDAEVRGEAEQAHLLYVALTRARDRLHVVGGDRAGRDPDAHASPLRDLLRAAAAARAAGCDVPVATPAAADDPLHEVARATTAAAARPAAVAPPSAPIAPPPPSLWEPPLRRPRFTLVTPSAAADDRREVGGSVDGTVDLPEPVPGPAAAPAPAGAAAALTGGVAPTVHGERVHRLLQAACEAGALPPGAGAAHDEAAGVFARQEFAWIFTPPADGEAWSEVPVIARRAAVAPGRAEQRITGVIDRLVASPGRVDIVDYKTNRGAADPAQRAWLLDHYRPQLAAYREAVTALFPGREVRAWLLFTDPALPADARLQAVD